ncbi:hypothetical protein [Actinosynnema sp. NPDC023587]|uniref:hypothetical protein n=1 Tax=Actinosynnema sp. NPDC023587 TaxID=3154695 RepID=UPI0034043F34
MSTELQSHQIFNAVADALIAVGVGTREKKRILASTMDVVGVPFLSFAHYESDQAITELFGERGIRRAAWAVPDAR